MVLVGVGRAGRLDLTLAYFKEIDVRGSNAYPEGGRPQALELLADGAIPHHAWLTHTFTLGRWREAFRLARSPGPNRSIKVVIQASDP